MLVGTLLPYNDDPTLVSEAQWGSEFHHYLSPTEQCEPALNILPSLEAGGPARN